MLEHVSHAPQLSASIAFSASVHTAPVMPHISQNFACQPRTRPTTENAPVVESFQNLKDSKDRIVPPKGLSQVTGQLSQMDTGVYAAHDRSPVSIPVAFVSPFSHSPQ